MTLMELYPWVNEFADGHDTLEWIGAQPWCDGNVGMTGGSYVGNVQWQAAVEGSSFLKTIIPRVIGNNLYESPHYQGGAVQLGWTAHLDLPDGRSDRAAYRPVQLAAGLQHTAPERPGRQPEEKSCRTSRTGSPILTMTITGRHSQSKERYQDINVTVFQIGGWYDFFTAGTLLNYVGMQKKGGSDLARGNQRVIIGPWGPRRQHADARGGGRLW